MKLGEVIELAPWMKIEGFKGWTLKTNNTVNQSAYAGYLERSCYPGKSIFHIHSTGYFFIRRNDSWLGWNVDFNSPADALDVANLIAEKLGGWGE